MRRHIQGYRRHQRKKARTRQKGYDDAGISPLATDHKRMGKVRHDASKIHLLETQEETCGHCCADIQWETSQMHHIKPLLHRGTNDISNLILLCLHCHTHADRGHIPPELLRDVARHREEIC